MYECEDVYAQCDCCPVVWSFLVFSFFNFYCSNGSSDVSVGPGINSGTTATVALLRDGIELVVASVGDSRAMLCRKGKAVKLTVDHTPERKDEKERYGCEDGVCHVTFGDNRIQRNCVKYQDESNYCTSVFAILDCVAKLLRACI